MSHYLISLGRHGVVGVRICIPDRDLPHHTGDTLPISDIETYWRLLWTVNILLSIGWCEANIHPELKSRPLSN